MALRPKDFDAFHRGVHGRPPFDWQQRLLEQIVERRSWPHTLDLPTAAGKTTCLDVALFALALDASRPSAARFCPRRIAMVVDRRVVVDQVAKRGRKLAAALANPTSEPILVEVAHALRQLRADPDSDLEPVGVFTLRGGVPKDDGWARAPDQPLILASTVDQLGSRLLIQGYGVRSGMRPLHAGLLGNDTLVLLDEVHLSQPFAETLGMLSRLRERGARTARLPARFHVAFLSATPGAEQGERFTLLPAERTLQSPLGRRLHARKAVALEEAEGREKLEARCAQRARELIAKHSLVAVVVNRVQSASRIVALLAESDPAYDVRLLTGRMRPLDRDDVMRELRQRIESGRERADGSGKPLIVVGTQCIEAGADFDFDAMVTEGASLDALRQRFGRVDRLGEYGDAAEGLIIFDKNAKKDDPVYGTAASETLAWLRTQLHKKTKTVDFGIAHLTLPEASVLEKLLAPKRHAPVLLPAYMDLWMQTYPQPAQLPDAALWLHGPQSGPADVQVIWRADLTKAMLQAKSDPDRRRVVNVVGAIRPSALEAISLPFASARAWLAEADTGEINDVEGSGLEDRGSADTEPRCLRWSGEDSKLCAVKELRPGDTIIVPATRGGIRERCFDPLALQPVSDLAEAAALHGRGQPMLRLHEDVLRSLSLAIDTQELQNPRDALTRLAQVATGWRRPWLERLATSRRRPIVVEGFDEEPWLVLQGRKLRAGELRAALDEDSTQEDGVALTTDEEDSYCAGRAVSLAEHSGDVERVARAYAGAVGLSEALSEDIALAGFLHDIGKADRRFQIMLREGSEISWLKDPSLWAKSAMSPEDRAAQLRAREKSGYPAGARHEVQSLAMIERHLEQVRAKANDLDLVRFLVASHHGYCRPFAPVAPDEHPVDVQLQAHVSLHFGSFEFTDTSSNNGLCRLDAGLADRFRVLVDKYGWLELCWLEAILRLADHRASESEQQEKDNP